MPKIVDHEEYRKELLERCLGLFTRKGFAQVTMREIAREIEVSTGTLYHYFPTKQTILEEMFAHLRNSDIGRYVMDSQQRPGPQNQRLENLQRFFLKHENFYRDVLLLALDIFRAQDIDDSRHVFESFSREYQNLFVKELELPEDRAQALFIFLLGLILHRILTPGFIRSDDQLSLILDMIRSDVDQDPSPNHENAD